MSDIKPLMMAFLQESNLWQAEYNIIRNYPENLVRVREAERRMAEYEGRMEELVRGWVEDNPEPILPHDWYHRTPLSGLTCRVCKLAHKNWSGDSCPGASNDSEHIPSCKNCERSGCKGCPSYSDVPGED